jgi:hypothetical protein
MTRSIIKDKDAPKMKKNQDQTDSSRSSRSYSQIKARIANRTKDIDMLLRAGSIPCQISQILGIHPDIVKRQVAAEERYQKEKD